MYVRPCPYARFAFRSCDALDGRPPLLSVIEVRRREFHDPTSDCESWKARVRGVIGDGLKEAALLLCVRGGSSFLPFGLAFGCWSRASPR